MSEHFSYLSPRREAVLRAVVEEYIANSSPVGSLRVRDLEDFGVSSATLRKEMHSLECLGFLSQPHVSAGRVPTEAGYRYFVDSLMVPPQMGEDAFHQIHDLFGNARGEIASLLESLSALLAELTCCAAVVVAPDAESATYCSIHLVELSPQVVLVVAVLSKGSIERRVLKLNEPIDIETLRSANEALSAALVSAPFGAEVEIHAPTRESQYISERAVEALQNSEGGLLFVGGQATMAETYGEVKKIARMLDLLEHHYTLIAVLESIVDRGMQVAIGEETGLEPPVDCSVVVSPYQVDGRIAGSVAVLGPTNMNYSTNVAAVSTMSSQLSQALSSG